MSIESTRKIMTKYFETGHSDTSDVADDAVFTEMSTGEEHRGKQAIQRSLNYVFHVAFDAKLELKNSAFADHQAVGEWDLVGKHIGEFAGVPATGKSVRVPLCVVYDLENDKIKKARVYLEVPILLKQLGVQPASASPAR
jgi:steroid delta-isomerase-like uncharacterized protein